MTTSSLAQRMFPATQFSTSGDFINALGNIFISLGLCCFFKMLNLTFAGRCHKHTFAEAKDETQNSLYADAIILSLHNITHLLQFTLHLFYVK